MTPRRCWKLKVCVCNIHNFKEIADSKCICYVNIFTAETYEKLATANEVFAELTNINIARDILHAP